MRNAISPRLAISTFSNIGARRRSLDQHQRGAVFDRFGVFDEYAGAPAAARRADLVHPLHRLDDQQRLALADLIADANEGWISRLWRQIGDADDRRGDRVRRRGAVESRA